MKKLFILLFIAVMSIAVVAKKNEKFPVKERLVDGFHFLYYEFKGPYQNAFKEFNSILSYMKENNIEAGPFSVGIYHDDPQQVKPENCRSEIGFMVRKAIKVSGKFKYRKIDGFKAISTRYKAMSEIVAAWNRLGKYMAEKKLAPAGPGFEFYPKESKVVDAECLMPIQ